MDVFRVDTNGNRKSRGKAHNQRKRKIVTNLERKKERKIVINIISITDPEGRTFQQLASIFIASFDLLAVIVSFLFTDLFRSALLHSAFC